MADSLTDALPWFGAGEDDEAASVETTPGSREATPWVVIGVNLSPGEAVIIKGRLESEEIPTLVQQEAMGVVLGLTVGPLGSAKILVPEPLAERALEILAETFEIDDEFDEESFEPDWDEEDETE